MFDKLESVEKRYEELTKLIKYQSAYNAASRYITVISQMTELIVTGLIQERE